MIGRSSLCGLAAEALLLPAISFGQEEEFPHLTLSAGAGLTTITGRDAGKLDHGANGRVVNNSGAFDTGGGLNIPLPRTRTKIFVEARYFKGFTSNTNTTIVPITVGIRW